jgi:REP element-mobilizing transposase RayT
MRIARCYLKDSGREQVFHVMSRVVDRRQVFGDAEKGVLKRIMRQSEGFCGVEVMTYCLMGNHFHILLRVPARPEVIESSEVFLRLGQAYPRDRVEAIRGRYDELAAGGRVEEAERHLDVFRRRMYDLSEFMKMVKQRFTQWYNREYERSGTLWEARYKCYVVERERGSLRQVAAYIDLNPVAAGMVSDPGEYEWSGFGEAVRGAAVARWGIYRAAGYDFRGRGSRSSALREYGAYLRERCGRKKGEENRMSTELSLFRESVRALANSLAAGSREFIEIFSMERNRSDFPMADPERFQCVGAERIFYLRRRRRSGASLNSGGGLTR